MLYCNFETSFLKNANPFQKTGVPFLVEGTKIENATFPCKIALSETNIKINRMGSTKLTYYKEQRFASNYFIFSKIVFHFKNLV